MLAAPILTKGEVPRLPRPHAYVVAERRVLREALGTLVFYVKRVHSNFKV